MFTNALSSMPSPSCLWFSTWAVNWKGPREKPAPSLDPQLYKCHTKRPWEAQVQFLGRNEHWHQPTATLTPLLCCQASGPEDSPRLIKSQAWFENIERKAARHGNAPGPKPGALASLASLVLTTGWTDTIIPTHRPGEHASNTPWEAESNKVKLSDSKYPTLKNLVEFKPWSSFLWLLLGTYPKYNLWQEDSTNSRAASRGNIVYTNGIIRALKSANAYRAFPKGEVGPQLSTSQALSRFILTKTQWAGTDTVPTLQMRSLGLREAMYLSEVMKLRRGGDKIPILVSLGIQPHHLAIPWWDYWDKLTFNYMTLTFIVLIYY